MAPTPQEHTEQINKEGMVEGQLADDEVVITGMSGLFPTCNNVKEFAEKLYANENMVKTDNRRWKYEHPELTEYCGNVPGLDKFDAQFFMVHFRLSNSMDAMSRKLLEHAYQAVFDAGISPQELSGKRVGCYIGTCLTETEKVCAYSHVGVGIVGCNRAMFSNRISYCLDLTGPSMTIDASCSGSMVCLERAHQAIIRGDCEAAIVGASNIHLHPQSCIHYGRLLKLNADGKTKCFDKYADGQSPAECISIIFLQKAKDAKRVYATVCSAKTEFSPLKSDHFDCYGPQRDLSVLSSFYYNFYKNSNISPSVVEYVEAFGSAFPEADKIELEAIEKVFCQNRDDPLYIGSVMSNIGYSQASTTVAAIVKVCIAYHTGKIAANLHCENPRDDIVALNEGRMRVVTKNKPFRRSYTAINSLSLTGINGHVLLRGEYKPKDISRYESKIPYLLTASGRQESAVEKIFDHLKSNQIDPEEIALFHNIHKTRVSKHLARGFVVLTPNEANEPVTIKEKVDYYDDAMRPLWFVYSGMGSQWNGMGTQLLRIPIFAAAIERCRKVLEPLGIDLMYILTSDDKTIYDNILHSFVGIAAVQIGLTDVLLQMGLVPDNIIGHSVGELGCAYADGCLTAEEMILSAYYRGLVSVQTPLIHGSLAAVGIGYQQIVTMCPPEVDVACHNSPESSTISGPSEVMREFVAKLMAQGIFAKEVPCSNIAYHSRYIKDAGPGLLEHLKGVIKNPKLRSKRWLSTSVPKEQWDEPAAKLCSADYHTNNLLNPVLFEETAKAVPNNAVLIEVAPHGLLQAILKRYLPSTCTNVPLTRRGHKDNALFMLESLGDLYMTGYNPDLSTLYPKIQFPVSTETRSLSHLIEWAHTEKWTLPVYVTADRAFAAAFDDTLSTHDDEHGFLRGHIIDDEMVFPFAACLVFVWDTLAMSMEVTRRQVSVQFHDIHFHVQPELYDNRLLRLSVEIHRGTGKFEMHNDNVLLVSGYIQEGTSHMAALYHQRSRSSTSSMEYRSNDIYRMFYDRGYGYRGDFRSIQEVNSGMTRALVSWNDNWVTFLDASIQLNALRRDNDALEQPRFIHKLYIDVDEHKQALVLSPNEVEANIFEEQNITRCGGVLMETITFMKKPPQVRQSIALKTLKFVPYQDTEEVEISAALNVFLQIISENAGSDPITALDITEGNKDSSLGRKIKEILPGLPDIRVSLKHMKKHDVLAPNNKIFPPHLMLLDNLLNDNDISEVLHEVVPRDVFVIVLEQGTGSHASYRVMASIPTPDGRLVLARWRPLAVSTACSAVVTVTSEKDLLFLQDTRKNMLPDNSLVILTNYPPLDRITELVKRWRKDTKRNKIFVAMIDQDNSHVWQDKSLPELHLAFNVLKQGVWGGYYFVSSAGRVSNDPKPVALRSAQIGNLNSLHWVETIAPGPKDIAVSVHYAGLNFYDAKKTTNEICLKHDETSELYGMDFSGLTDNGERVMGVIRGGAASSRVAAESSLLWPVPAHWTLEDAATIPLPYAHAFYCLGVKNKLQRGMSILIHGAAGALGQAALSIALAHGCQVFATVGDIRKKRFLRKMFPNLPEDNIGNSRDVSFGDMVLGATKGEGCSIIISCVKGSLKNVTLTCCATSGVTFDTHQIHSKENYAYGMYNMTRTRSYVSLDFSSIFTEEKFQEMEQLQLMISEGIAKGYVRPLSRVVYAANEANCALRLLAASRHRGRALLKIHGEALPATPRLAIQPESSHLLLADSADNAVAVRMVDLLIARGATKIIAHLQQDPNTFPDTYTQMKIKMWEKFGAEVKVTSENLEKTDKVEALMKDCNKMGPLEGIYALVADVNAASEAKMRVALENLDFASRTLSSLKYFAVIGKGTKFGVENCMNRVRNGFPAMVLQLPNVDKFTQCAEVADTTFVTKPSFGIRRAISAIETALCSSQPISLAFAETLPEESLLEAISRISGVFIGPKSKDVSSLEQLGFSPEKYVKFIRILQKFNVHIPQEKALRMNLGELKATQKKLDDMKNKVVTGLEVFYSCVHENELLATTDIVFIPTAAQKSTMRDDEFDCNATYLVMVPGMDGHHGKFELLCERLKLPVAVLQPGLDHPHETVSHMAERMVKVMLNKIKPKQNFYLMGYSFGVLVALEMTIILEERGLTGVVFCVDASPDTFPSALESLLGSSTGLQDAVVQHMYSLMVGDSSQQLADELRVSNTWQDKVDAGIKALRAKVPHSVQYARLMIEAAYARIEQARLYDVKKVRARPLSSQLVVLRSRHQPSGVPSDLGLSRYTRRVPHVYELAEDHAHALEDLRCANIVNRHLDQSILDAFHNKNLCVTYLLNASTYTQFSADYD